MGYTEEFVMSEAFEAYCLRFLEMLPREMVDPPLMITYTKAAAKRAKWQWYNYFEHFKPKMYTIKMKENPANPIETILTIKRKAPLKATDALEAKRALKGDAPPSMDSILNEEEQKKLQELIKEEEAKEKKPKGFDMIKDPPKPKKQRTAEDLFEDEL